jgi:hypothetical protein
VAEEGAGDVVERSVTVLLFFHLAMVFGLTPSRVARALRLA